jgi:NTP pyrophosphatase (non-canonical NTP hydrolase)
MAEQESGESFGAGEFQFSNYAQGEAVALLASYDTKLRCAVIHTQSGDIKAIIPNGKIKVSSTGAECDECNEKDMAFARYLTTPTIPTGHRVVSVEPEGGVSYRGFYKLVEEMGELLTVLGKLGPFPSGKHPDGAGDLRARIQDELADVMAAARYFAKEGNFSHSELDKRAASKVAKFNEWGLTGIATADQIDASPDVGGV